MAIFISPGPAYHGIGTDSHDCTLNAGPFAVSHYGHDCISRAEHVLFVTEGLKRFEPREREETRSVLYPLRLAFYSLLWSCSIYCEAVDTQPGRAGRYKKGGIANQVR